MSKYHAIIRYPSITEKNTILREQGKYVFEVAVDATKFEIKEAVQKIFDVEVEAVNTAIIKGKKKRVGRNVGYRPDRKKAVVKLKAGQTIAKFGDV